MNRTRRICSVHEPMEQLVDELNAYQPVFLVGYARTIAQLAIEQAEGRLQIRPVTIIVTAESLGTDEYDQLARMFQTKVCDNDGCTEAAELSYGCEHRWHHVNGDWFVLEPVDADYNATPPGKHSHTVLLTNLVNRVQPILRDDLGDSVVLRPNPCPCSNPLPAIRVQGRSSEVTTFPRKDGSKLAIAPMAFTTLLERVRGLDQDQLVQTAQDVLEIRMKISAEANRQSVRAQAQSELRTLLHDRGLTHVSVSDSGEAPQQTEGGKYHAVIPHKS